MAQKLAQTESDTRGSSRNTFSEHEKYGVIEIDWPAYLFDTANILSNHHPVQKTKLLMKKILNLLLELNV